MQKADASYMTIYDPSNAAAEIGYSSMTALTTVANASGCALEMC